MSYRKVRDTYNHNGMYVCDTEADMDRLPKKGHERIGTRAFVAETSNLYILAESGWKPVDMCCGGGGSGGGGGGSETKTVVTEIDGSDNTMMTSSKLVTLEDGTYITSCKYGMGDLYDKLHCTQVPAKIPTTGLTDSIYLEVESVLMGTTEAKRIRLCSSVVGSAVLLMVPLESDIWPEVYSYPEQINISQ